MLLKDLKPEWIRTLNEIGKQLQDVTVKMPSANEQQMAKDIIEQILPPDEGYATKTYVRNVLIAFEYAKTHGSMLDDIKTGKFQIKNMEDYYEKD